MTKYFRAGILNFSTVLQIMEEAEQFMAQKEFKVNSTEILRLVSNSPCSAYDCEFVGLANDFDIKLLTFDKKIVEAFPNIALRPKQFIS